MLDFRLNNQGYYQVYEGEASHIWAENISCCMKVPSSGYRAGPQGNLGKMRKHAKILGFSQIILPVVAHYLPLNIMGNPSVHRH